MVAVWRCGQHARVNSVPHNAVWTRITRLMRIEFALGNSVTEPVESGFSVNRPLDASICSPAMISL